MKLHHQYLQLHSRFGARNMDEHTGVTLDELASVLGCTHRNALTVIRRMEQLEWIEWRSQRGRGARSVLRFRIPAEEIAAQSMTQAIRRKDVRLAIEDLRRHAGASSLQGRLQGWLLSYFGHHAEVRSDRQIDSLRLPIRQPMQTIDPLKMNLLAESFIASHVFDGLIRRAGDTGTVVPGLAHAWESNEDRTVWTFFLRKGVLFHNGSLMTADDVAYTFERLAGRSRRSLYSSIFQRISDVAVLNLHTLRMTLKEPCELFLPSLCTTRASIVPRYLDQRGESEFGQRPIGTGPFKVTVFQDSLCVLESFPHYHQGQAHLDRIEIVHVPWELNENQTEVIEGLSPFHVIPGQPVSPEGTWIEMHSHVSVRKFITCNTRKSGPLQDPQVRAQIMGILSQVVAVESTSADDRLRSPRLPLCIATITPYQPDADRVARQLEAAGYACRVQSSSVEEFKGDIRLQADLIVFSLLRDQDEQLRRYDLYQTIAEHVELRRQSDIQRQLRAVAREQDSRRRDALLSRAETEMITANELAILSEKPLQTAFLPSVRGVSFNSQGWVDLRNLWFPPKL
ncbi:ABC transporter substrate-binding protein [Paenibacillus rubinfantis]|uniref:ABC transporter substrate-binding protein n=1 Tax=Paenibacillus rubinfantis TaxID=1720296 RepID=UPI00073EADCC|nr:ABC transporter substrate-binding protein [Paenibacillus rubinfantis]